MSGQSIAAEVSQALLEVGQEVGSGEFVAMLQQPATDTPANPWEPPGVTQPDPIALRVMLSRWTRRELDSEFILATDKKLMVEAQGTVPTVADKIRVLGKWHEILDVQPAAFGGVDLYYMIQARA